MDPRGLISSPDIDFDVPVDAWREYTQTTRSSLRSLAELTGGISIVNTNNFDELLAQIDADTSDYYVLGFYATNPNGTDRTRELSVDVNRPEVTVRSRGSYTFCTDSSYRKNPYQLLAPCNPRSPLAQRSEIQIPGCRSSVSKFERMGGCLSSLKLLILNGLLICT